MADLTVGEIGVTLQVQLNILDSSQSPPAQVPLDLTNATLVELLYLITDPISIPPAQPTKTVPMGILAPATSGTVFYNFVSGDLAKPAGMSKNGVFKYTIRVTFANSNVLYLQDDQILTIKDDGVL